MAKQHPGLRIDDVTVTKTTHANQKLWMTAEVCGLLKTRDEAFRSGDKAVLKKARANVLWHQECKKQSLHRQQRHTEPVASHSDHQ